MKFVSTGDESFSCDFCGRAEKFKAMFKAHMLTHLHNDEKPIKCDECNKGYKYHCELRSHKLLHLNAKPFECDLCNKAYSMKYSLKAHIEMNHLNNFKEYSCKKCSYAGKSQQRLESKL